MNWYVDVLKKYAVFQGRAGRQEYWMFFLFNIVISFVLGIIDGVFGRVIDQPGFALLGGLYGLAVLLPGIAVGVRRLHDTGRPGGWLFIALIPFVGVFVLLYYLVLDGTPGPNQYGPDPLGRAGYAQAGYAPMGYAPQGYAPQGYAPQGYAPQQPASAPAGWLADPSGRHQFRYWDGAKWTENVSDNGATSIDPV